MLLLLLFQESQKRNWNVYSQKYSDWTAIPGILPQMLQIQYNSWVYTWYVEVASDRGQWWNRHKAMRETGSDNLQVCPLGEGQSGSCSVNSTMRHRANPLMERHNLTIYMLTHHFLSSWYYGWDNISLTTAYIQHIYQNKIRWYASTSNSKGFSKSLFYA